MGLQYIYFTARDDAAAITVINTPGPVPEPKYFDELIRADELDTLEHLLTGRDITTIRADPRFNLQVHNYFLEEAGVDEAGLFTVTDSFTSAVAAQDRHALPDAYSYCEQGLDELAVVARHAIAHHHHMYCLWLI